MPVIWSVRNRRRRSSGRRWVFRSTRIPPCASVASGCSKVTRCTRSMRRTRAYADERVVDATARPEGGESLDDLYERARMFVDGLADRARSGDVVIVTHGGTIRALRAYCAGAAHAAARRWDVVPNGSVWKIELPAIVQATKR